MPDNRVRQALQVFQRMNLSLPRKTDRAMRLKSSDGRILYPFYFKAGAPAGLEFLFQILQRLVRRLEEIAIEPLEIAVDLFGGSNRFHPIDRRAVALRGHARP